MAHLVRRAGRAIVIYEDRVLLMRGGDPSNVASSDWLFAIGGGAEPGETTSQAVRREAYEEAGLNLPQELGHVVLLRHAEFDFGENHYQQAEDYWIVRVGSPALTTDGWTEQERRDVKETAVVVP